MTPRREQPAAEDAAFISIQAFPALLDLPQELEVSEVSCGSRHTAIVTRESPAWGGGSAQPSALPGRGEGARGTQQPPRCAVGAG